MSSLPSMRIATPCNARWGDMTGDERTRFCGHCQKHVYNISEMQPTEVMELVRVKEGTFCARIYQRKDGTILTADCPVGKERFFRKMKITLCSVIGATLFLFAARLVSGRDVDRARTVTIVERAWDEVVWNVKELFGIQRPIVFLGKISVPPAPASTPTNPPTPFNMKTFWTLFLLGCAWLAGTLNASAMAAYFDKVEAVRRAEIIAIVDVVNVQSNKVKGRGWTYSEVADAMVEQVLKGTLPPAVKLHGGENFICAQVRYKPGRHLVFLNRDGELLSGFNWHLATLAINEDTVEWFQDDRSIKKAPAKLQTAITEIEEILRNDWPVLVQTRSDSRKPTALMFALWADGTALRVDNSGKVLVGRLNHPGPWRIWQTLRKSGFFKTEREEYRVPDADYETIMVHQGSEAKIHSWHGVLKPGFGGNVETDAEYRQFVEMWQGSEEAITKAELTEVKSVDEVARNGFFRGYNLAEPHKTSWFNPRLWRERIAAGGR